MDTLFLFAIYVENQFYYWQGICFYKPNWNQYNSKSIIASMT